ncbi:hypothetical protein V6N13_053643 [Hibiscus sabdariffa]
MGGQSYQNFNNPLQIPSINEVLIDGAPPRMDIQMGLEFEDNPIEHSDGNKRPRTNIVATGVSSSQDSDVTKDNIVLTSLINQAPREP